MSNWSGDIYAPRPGALMSRAEIDMQLNLLASSVEKMSAALVDLESNPGLGVLRNYPQTGTTASAWKSTKDVISGLWADFDRYQAVIAQARTVRARHKWTSLDDQTELTELLRGTPIDLGSLALPGTGNTGRIGLDGLAEKMNQAWQQIHDLADRVDVASTAVRNALSPVQDANRADLARLDPDDAERAAGQAIADRVADLNERSVTDALSIPDPAAAVAELAAAQARWHQVVDDTLALRAGWSDQVVQLRLRAAEVGQVAARARQARADVAATIASAPLPPVPDRLAGVNELVTAVDRAAGWAQQRAAFRAADRGVSAALTAARADEELAAGLLRRRTELRGRLSAYRSKATRLGRADSPTTAAAYRAAADTLAATPCDLRAATRLVAAYQDLVIGTAQPSDQPGRTA